jgi:ferritin-like metal-binding protein YciE
MDNPIIKYLEDAIAAEKSFETQLNGFASEASNTTARNLFASHAQETKIQYENLTSRLEALGGSTSTLKSFLAHFFNSAPKVAQAGHKEEERTTQDLMMAFAVENAEVAMYEVLATASQESGDLETSHLARRIQKQEQETADKVWKAIAPSASQAYTAVTTGGGSPRDVIVRYLEDAEAAERNFEDALAGFSKSGDQNEVKSLMATMSKKAKTQHERLQNRLESLGGSPSGAKSALAHILAFTPLSAQLGHTEAEKNTQHLMIVYAAAAAEMAMYEALATAASLSGDETTASLARQLQTEEKEDHELAWAPMGRTARAGLEAVLSRP